MVLNCILQPGTPEQGEVAAQLIYQSDPAYFDFLFGAQRAHVALCGLWQQDDLYYACQRAQVWQKEGQLLGLVFHHATGAVEHPQANVIDPGMAERLAMLTRLFPPLPDHAWYLQTLTIAAASRRQGLGLCLVQAVVRQARNQGAQMLLVDVDTGNPAAVHFYQSQGFFLQQETLVAELLPFNLPASWRMVLPLE